MNYPSPLTCIDFYKADHRRQYPEGTELVVSNFTPRYNKYANVPDKDGIVFFGLQYFIIDFLATAFTFHFFDVDKDTAVAKYKRRLDNALGKDSVPVEHIAALHDRQHLPIEIRSVKEGTYVPINVPVLTIHNTEPEFFWLVNYLETILSTYLWHPSTSATTARAYKKLFLEYAEKTGSSKEFTDFQGHDFSFRGMTSLQSALMSGAAHLLSFKGTDTVPAIDFLETYYKADSDKELVGCSVPATEHSVMCMGGEDDEIGTFRRLITHLYPKGIVSIVSDTWDFWKVISEYSLTLHQEIMSREGKVVFRPDSGNPADVICGTNRNMMDMALPERSSEEKGAVEVLWEIFGGTTNAAGFKELDPHVGLIYGDSIDYEMAQDILQRLEVKGFAASNIVFGVGSYTYQYVTRDTWGWAVKATFGRVNGVDKSICKKPKTDSGKNSHKGLLFVGRDANGIIYYKQECTWDEFTSESNLLEPVFKDGSILRVQTLSEIRELVNASIQGS